MRANVVMSLAIALVAGVAASTVVSAQASATNASLGTVRIPEKVMANGQPLAAGTYTLRLSDEAVTPVVGQSEEKWVEFLQHGQVKGKELASVVAPEDVKAVAKGAPPAKGKTRVQLLRGADYIRVWVNDGGTQYLVHLSTAKNAKNAA